MSGVASGQDPGFGPGINSKAKIKVISRNTFINYLKERTKLCCGFYTNSRLPQPSLCSLTKTD